MKKAVIVFIVAALVLITCGIWFFSAKTKVNPIDILSFGIIILVVSFAIFFGFKRLTGARRGEPDEDELSKRILQRASSTAYYISLYMWLVFIYLSDKIKLETHTLIGAGILGMAIIFCICWIIFNFRGIKNE
jgi:peptidoglycan/LPS O-acetylase OafA/YrhL